MYTTFSWPNFDNGQNLAGILSSLHSMITHSFGDENEIFREIEVNGQWYGFWSLGSLCRQIIIIYDIDYSETCL